MRILYNNIVLWPQEVPVLAEKGSTSLDCRTILSKNEEVMEGLREVYDLCTFKGCINEVWTYGKSLFPFPPIDTSRFEIWLENCGNKSILSRSEIRKRKLGLCSDHFSPDSFYDEDKTKLREDAVPEPYSPTFKRLNPLTKVNTRIYDHNYALKPEDVDTTLEATYKKKLLYPVRICKPQNRVVPQPSNSGSKLGSLSPKVKREKPALSSSRNKLSSRKAEGKSSSPIGVEAKPATSSVGDVSPSKRGKRGAGGKKGTNSGSKDKEVGMLQDTNSELKTQNKLLRKLNGQLKLKVKRSEDRNSVLKVMLEKACSIDGFLDLHKCTNLAVRNLIKEEIYKCKTKQPRGKNK